MPTRDELKMLQALPLDLKVKKSLHRTREWVDYFGEDGVYIAFSGGKDSTVLLHLVRSLYPNVPAVFCDTGLEYPEIREFVKTFDNVVWLKPSMNFKAVIDKYGYPFISKEVSECVYNARRWLRSDGAEGVKPHVEKLLGLGNYKPVKGGGDAKYRKLIGMSEYADKNRKAIRDVDERQPDITKWGGQDRSSFSCEKWKFLLLAPFQVSSECCRVMKKKPFHDYEKETGRKGFTGQMADESRLRLQKWLQNGCNSFEGNKAKSNPMSFWTENDVLAYIKQNNLPIASVYGEIVEYCEGLEGQMSMDFVEKKYKTTGCERTGCMFCGYGCHLEKGIGRFERMKETHPTIYNYIMKPVENGGLGYKEVIDWLNENGDLHIKY